MIIMFTSQEIPDNVTVLPDYFSVENWDAVLSLMPPEVSDNGKLYIEMMADLEENERQVIQDGKTPVRVKVDANDSKSWVESRGLNFAPEVSLIYAIHKFTEDQSGESVKISEIGSRTRRGTGSAVSGFMCITHFLSALRAL